MRLLYINGKLFISCRKDEAEDIKKNEGKPCEIDVGNIKILHEDISGIVKQRLKELE